MFAPQVPRKDCWKIVGVAREKGGEKLWTTGCSFTPTYPNWLRGSPAWGSPATADHWASERRHPGLSPSICVCVLGWWNQNNPSRRASGWAPKQSKTKNALLLSLLLLLLLLLLLVLSLFCNYYHYYHCIITMFIIIIFFICIITSVLL